MKKLYASSIILLLLSFCTQQIYSQNRSIKFEESSWSSIIEKAKSENKIIFLDAFASWCSPCKYLAAKVFTVDSVADFFNNNFINSHFDMEKGEGIDLRIKYNVKAFPTLIFINKDGEIVHQSVGSCSPTEFIQLGKDALNPAKQLIGFKRKFENGDRSPEFILSYLGVLKNAMMNTDAVASEYLQKLKNSELKEKANWQIITNFVDDVNSREIKYLIKNKKEFSKIYTEKEVDTKIKSAFSNEFTKVIRNTKSNKNSFDSLKSYVKTLGYDKINEVMLKADFLFYKSKKDVDNYVKAGKKFLKLKETSAEDLNGAAWFVFTNSQDKNLLSTASGWAKRGLNLQKEAAIYDTYANLQFKLGNKKEAIKYEETALELAKTAGQDTAEYEKTLNDMEK